MRKRSSVQNDDQPALVWAEPLKPFRTILDEEIHQAMHELQRPALGLVLLGFLAGMSIGVTLLLVSTVRTLTQGHFFEPAVELLAANVYTIGFILLRIWMSGFSYVIVGGSPRLKKTLPALGAGLC
jgi:ABC-type methionine transport system permease subunit